MLRNIRNYIMFRCLEIIWTNHIRLVTNTVPNIRLNVFISNHVIMLLISSVRYNCR